MPDTIIGRLVAFACSALVILPVAAAEAVAVAAVPADAAPIHNPIPIGHRQHFEGMVNGHTPRAHINVICGGPATTGHPGRGQTVRVVRVIPPFTRYQGFTGSAANRIAARLTWPTATGSPLRIASFTSYGVNMPIPTSIKVPCSGTGTMVFVPLPGSTSARRAIVHVSFQSLGV